MAQFGILHIEARLVNLLIRLIGLERGPTLMELLVTVNYQCYFFAIFSRHILIESRPLGIRKVCEVPARQLHF
jgi:hypothetical protein